MANDLLPLH